MNDRPDDYDALLVAARYLCIERRDYQAGRALADRVVELKPDLTASYLPLFSCLLGAGRGKPYAEQVLKTIERIPDDATLYFHLGVAHRVAKRRLDSLAAFERSIELDPSRAATYYQAGGVALAIRRYEQAEHLFRETLRLTPDDPDAHWQLARVLKYQGRNDEAEKLFKAAVQTDSPMAAYEYGIFLFEAERLEEAVPVLQSYVQKDPRGRMGWHYLARIHRQLGNRNKAEKAMERFRVLQKERDEQDDASLRKALFGDRPPPAPRDEDG